MDRVPRAVAAAAAVLLLLAGCGTEPAAGPPEIQVGLEECGHCRMIISEAKHAAAVVDVSGPATPFDDVGCLLDHLRERATPPASVWVHDRATGAWIAAESAWFVRGPRSSTPMGSGLVAFASRREAETFATQYDATVVAWSDGARRLMRDAL